MDREEIGNEALKAAFTFSVASKILVSLSFHQHRTFCLLNYTLWRRTPPAFLFPLAASIWEGHRGGTGVEEVPK